MSAPQQVAVSYCYAWEKSDKDSVIAVVKHIICTYLAFDHKKVWLWPCKNVYILLDITMLLAFEKHGNNGF